MIDENKVKMRTKLAKFEYETRRSKSELESLNRGTYVFKGIFWTFVATTVAYLAAVVLVTVV